MIDKVMTVKEVAKYLDVHPMTIYKLAKKREIPAFKVGGQWRFRKVVLNKWVDRETDQNKGFKGK